MTTVKKAMLEVSKMKMTPALSAEHQRKWDASQWECKADDPERNYDPSRVHLNFEVRKGGVIAHVDQSVNIKDKVDARIAEWKAERLAATGVEPKIRSTQHLSVCIIMGGNRDRMNELAFGDQVLQERGNNAHIKRMKEIEQFALDNYNALAKRVGEKNIISFIVHCDEKNCHIHATIVPILEDGRLCAKDMFGGSSRDAARDKMREWHDWYAAINAKWGLERGDDIHESGARRKSLEEHNRELHRENKTLEETIEMKRRAINGLNTMIGNLAMQRLRTQKQIDKLESQLQRSDSDKAQIAKDISRLQEQLKDVTDKLEDKVQKLSDVKEQLGQLKEEYNNQKDLVADEIKFGKEVLGYLNQHTSVMLKAAILDQVLADAANICRKIPDAAAMAEDTFIDDRNFLRWNDVLRTGAKIFLNGLSGNPGAAVETGGGGTKSDMPWRDKDEDYLHWAWRAMLMAHAKHYPGNRLGRKMKVG